MTTLYAVNAVVEGSFAPSPTDCRSDAPVDRCRNDVETAIFCACDGQTARSRKKRATRYYATHPPATKRGRWKESKEKWQEEEEELRL
jgi:hypothetical protein